jgi:hypothetical protein
MKIKILALFLMINLNSFGTAQIPDRLIYKGDTLSFFATPLGQLTQKEILNTKSLFGGNGCFFSACLRNCIATWSIEDNKLYLISIRNACYPTELKNVAGSYKAKSDSIGTEYADLQKLFPDKYINGKVLADWVTDTIFAPKGKLLYYIHMGFESIYEKELELKIIKGELVQAGELDNSKLKRSKYSLNNELQNQFLQSRINYSKLPKSKVPILVNITLTNVNEKGQIEGAEVTWSQSEIFNKEALRVVKLIPVWDILYQHGKRVSIQSTLTVVFYPVKPKPLEYQLPSKAAMNKKQSKF